LAGGCGGAAGAGKGATTFKISGKSVAAATACSTSKHVLNNCPYL